MPTVADVLERLDEAFPSGWAEPWDNTGLQCGEREAAVSRVILALDPTRATIDEAIDGAFELLVTHHPLVLEPAEGEAPPATLATSLAAARRGGLAVIACHTNADVAPDGVNDVLAERLGLLDVEPLLATSEHQGLGRLGRPAGAESVATVAARCEERLGTPPRLIGDRDASVRRIAVCGGSGSSLIPLAAAVGADVLITADVKHHGAIAARELGLAVIDAGHAATEWPFVEVLAERLAAWVPELQVGLSGLPRDPFELGDSRA